MKLTIDWGNTAVKLLVYNSGGVAFRKVYKRLTVGELRSIYKRFEPEGVILSSVVKTPVSIKNYLKKQANYIELNPRTKLPFKNLYKTPHTLGNDRIAAVAAAQALFPGRNTLVIDLGTCIKFDLIDHLGKYHGGSISPGMNMRFLALNHYTGRLPLIKPEGSAGLIGNSTKNSILNGVILGMLCELEGMTSFYLKKYKNLKIVMTGGDAPRFAGKLKLTIFAAPDLVSAGLLEILNFNTGND